MSQPPQSSTSPRSGNPTIAAARRKANATPPVALVLLSIVSVQLGAALAKGLFGALGPLGTVFLRVGFAALVLLALWRPRLSQLSPLAPSPAEGLQPVQGTGPARHDWWAMLLVAILSSFIPFSLELEALRRLPARVFGVLMSLEPAMATLIGWVALREAVQVRALVAVALITLASAGAAFLG